MGVEQPILCAAGLRKVFRDGEKVNTVVDGAAVQLHRSEVVALVGPSGSGKSTLLALLSGLLRPDAGRVTVAGEDLWAGDGAHLETHRSRHFGFVFQGYNLFPALTARQQLEITLRWTQGVHAREARRRSERMLDRLGLGGRMNLRPAQLSGGEKQRVAVGRALVKNPALVFADEPTSALDWAHGQNVVALLRDAAHDCRAAVLIVTHDPRVVQFADRGLKMGSGRVAAVATREPEPAGAH
jgi:putative ABC transport system ATP-binding protein